MNRRIRALGVALALAAPLVAVVNVASAAAPCTVRANLPARITIDRQDVVTAVRLTGCEGRLNELGAQADFDGPPGRMATLSWIGTRVVNLHLYAIAGGGIPSVRPGVYRTADGIGTTTDDQSVGWQYTTTTVKFGTRTGLAVSRRGSAVSITVATWRFDAGLGFIGYGNHVVAIQHALSPSGPWTTIGYAKVNAAGRATITKSAPAARYYRAYFGDSASFFGSSSGAIRR